MDLRTAIERKIDAARREMNELKMEMARKESFILGLEETLKVIPKREAERRKGSDLRVGSVTEEIFRLLQKSGKPLHVREIISGIGKDPDDRNIVQSIAGTLSGYVRKKEIFSRPAANTFGLIESEHNDVIGDFEDEKEVIDDHLS